MPEAVQNVHGSGETPCAHSRWAAFSGRSRRPDLTAVLRNAPTVRNAAAGRDHFAVPCDRPHPQPYGRRYLRKTLMQGSERGRSCPRCPISTIKPRYLYRYFPGQRAERHRGLLLMSGACFMVPPDGCHLQIRLSIRVEYPASFGQRVFEFTPAERSLSMLRSEMTLIDPSTPQATPYDRTPLGEQGAFSQTVDYARSALLRGHTPNPAALGSHVAKAGHTNTMTRPISISTA